MGAKHHASLPYGTWTRIKIPVDKMASPQDYRPDPLGIATSGWASPPVNTVIYLSAMYGVNEEEILKPNEECPSLF